MIKLINIKKTYQVKNIVKTEALKGINLEVSKGEALAIQGASGSGKSTLLHILGCLDSATEGEYFLDEQKITFSNSNKIAEIRNKKIGFVLQKFGLLNDRTAIENVYIPLLFSKSPLKNSSERALSLLKELDIGHLSDVSVSCLSGGEQQRVAIARALINDPDLILADEPTGALDSKTGLEIINILTSLTAKGKTLIMVTHDNSIAQKCNRIITIKDGVILK